MRYSFCLDFRAGLLSRRHDSFLESCRPFGLSISVLHASTLLFFSMYKGCKINMLGNFCSPL